MQKSVYDVEGGDQWGAIAKYQAEKAKQEQEREMQKAKEEQ
jgi:hypothetical protein